MPTLLLRREWGVAYVPVASPTRSSSAPVLPLLGAGPLLHLLGPRCRYPGRRWGKVVVLEDHRAAVAKEPKSRLKTGLRVERAATD